MLSFLLDHCEIGNRETWDASLNNAVLGENLGHGSRIVRHELLIDYIERRYTLAEQLAVQSVIKTNALRTRRFCFEMLRILSIQDVENIL